MASPDLLSLSVIDGTGTPGSFDLFVTIPPTATRADIQAFVDDYLTQHAGITSAQIATATMRLNMNVSSGGGTAAPDSRVEETGLFNYNQVGSKYKYGIDVPALKDSVIVNGKVDLTNAQITSWKNFILTGSHGIAIVSKFALLITQLLDVLLTFRKHRRALDRRSFETP